MILYAQVSCENKLHIIYDPSPGKKLTAPLCGCYVPVRGYQVVSSEPFGPVCENCIRVYLVRHKPKSNRGKSIMFEFIKRLFCNHDYKLADSERYYFYNSHNKPSGYVTLSVKTCNKCGDSKIKRLNKVYF